MYVHPKQLSRWEDGKQIQRELEGRLQYEGRTETEVMLPHVINTTDSKNDPKLGEVGRIRDLEENTDLPVPH